MPKHVILCADDYALSDGTSAVIRKLLAAGHINATTCLVETEAWARCAPALRDLAQDRTIAVGLHLNLTEHLPGCASPDVVKPIDWWLGRMARPKSDALVDAVASTFRVQWERFLSRFGRPPDFLDGHQHVHLIPPVRQALFRLVAEQRFKGWLRQCRTSSRRWISHRILFDPLSTQLVRKAEAFDVSVNSGFGGLRWFRRSEDLEQLWRTDLAALGEGGLLILHPGAADSPPGSDGIDSCRLEEAALIAKGRLRDLL